MTNVIFYHQNGCGMCRAVEMMLNKRDIKFESVLISSDNIDEYMDKGITSTPTLDVDGKRFVKKECLDWINSLRG